MEKNKIRHYEILALSVLLCLTSTLSVLARQDVIKPGAQAVAQTALLPVYGVDLSFNKSWVDGSRFPSQSADYSHFGASATLQNVWDTLKLSGFNIIRFTVDVRESESAANRVANLCVWAKNNNVRLIPILVGADRGQQLGVDFPANISAFIKGLLTDLLGGDGHYLEAYSQILAYQLEDEMNHDGLRGVVSVEAVQLRLLKAAHTLRQAEQEALKVTALKPTPLMMNASFDFELIRVRAMTGATLGDDAYSQAYQAIKQFLDAFASSPEIDLIGVDWYAGSLSAGGVEKFPALLRSLQGDLAGKQLVFTTGFSTAFRPAEEQKQFYALTFANLADYRASAGVDSPFVGVFFHEALNGKEPDPVPPTPTLSREMAQWDWAAKADELARMWSGQAKSEALAWWLKKVENNMGLLALNSDRADSVTVTAKPAQEGLQQIAKAVSEANTAATADNTVVSASTSAGGSTPLQAPSSTGPSIGMALKEKAQQGLMSLLDRVFERLGNLISSIGSRSGGNQYGNNPYGGGSTGGLPNGGQPGGNPPTGGQTNPASAFISVAKENVIVEPISPHVAEQTTFTISLRNQSADVDASGLGVALMDDETGWQLGADTLVVGVNVARNTTQSIVLHWMPVEPSKSYRISVKVFDASHTQMASVSLDTVTVQPRIAPPLPAPSSGAGVAPGITNASLAIISPKIQALTVGAPGQILTEGQVTSVILSMSNPYARAFTNVKATLLVDGRPIETKIVGALLPQQYRSLLFTNVPITGPGKHNVRVSLESDGAKPQMAPVTSQVQVNPNVGKGQEKSGQATITTGPEPKTTPNVRSIFLPSFTVGPVTVPTATGSGKAATSPGKTSGNNTAASNNAAAIRPGRISDNTVHAGPFKTDGGAAATGPVKTGSISVTNGSTATTGSIKSPGKAAIVVSDKQNGSIVPTPDLSVSAGDIGFNPNPPRANTPLAFKVGVRNLGNGDAREVKVLCALFADGKPAARREFITNIKAGGLYTAEWSIVAPLSWQLRLDVSALAEQDANPKNNQATIRINLVSNSPSVVFPPKGTPRPDTESQQKQRPQPDNSNPNPPPKPGGGSTATPPATKPSARPTPAQPTKPATGAKPVSLGRSAMGNHTQLSGSRKEVLIPARNL